MPERIFRDQEESSDLTNYCPVLLFHLMRPCTIESNTALRVVDG